MVDAKDRVNTVINIIQNEKEVLKLERKIGQRVKKSDGANPKGILSA